MSLFKLSIYNEGRNAYKKGHNINDNPFIEATSLYELWMDGFHYEKNYKKFMEK